MTNRGSHPGYYTVSGEAEKRRSLENAAIAYQNIESDVKFLLDVRNMTEWRLWPDKCYIHWGKIPIPPTFILPGEKGAIYGQNQEGHYSGVYVTGATGVVSWKIGSTGKKLAIMYSLPYNFEDGKNKLAIAIVDENQKINKKFCREMIVNKELATLNVFYDEIKPIEVESDQFHVLGTMGNSHHCEIKVIFMPAREQNYAPRFLCESQYESTSGTPASTSDSPGSSSSGLPVKEEHLKPITGTPPGPSSGSLTSTDAPVKEDGKKIVDPLLHNVLANLDYF